MSELVELLESLLNIIAALREPSQSRHYLWTGTWFLLQDPAHALLAVVRTEAGDQVYIK